MLVKANSPTACPMNAGPERAPMRWFTQTPTMPTESMSRPSHLVQVRLPEESRTYWAARGCHSVSVLPWPLDVVAKQSDGLPTIGTRLFKSPVRAVSRESHPLSIRCDLARRLELGGWIGQRELLPVVLKMLRAVVVCLEYGHGVAKVGVPRGWEVHGQC